MEFLFHFKNHGIHHLSKENLEISQKTSSTWIPTTKNEIDELPNGFGKSYNIGARSMIEYPEGSGNLVIGTFKLKSFSPLIPEEGCEVWHYYQ